MVFSFISNDRALMINILLICAGMPLLIVVAGLVLTLLLLAIIAIIIFVIPFACIKVLYDIWKSTRKQIERLLDKDLRDLNRRYAYLRKQAKRRGLTEYENSEILMLEILLNRR